MVFVHTMDVSPKQHWTTEESSHSALEWLDGEKIIIFLGELSL